MVEVWEFGELPTHFSFGARLRYAREKRGWSRFRLTLAIKERFRADGITISEAAIELLEVGVTRKPRPTTENILSIIFPELGQTRAATET